MRLGDDRVSESCENISSTKIPTSGNIGQKWGAHDFPLSLEQRSGAALPGLSLVLRDLFHVGYVRSGLR